MKVARVSILEESSKEVFHPLIFFWHDLDFEEDLSCGIDALNRFKDKGQHNLSEREVKYSLGRIKDDFGFHPLFIFWNF